MTNDLTKGNPDRVLLSFSLPLFVSVIFQQLYSIADSVIAGRYAGDTALAAIGVSYPITMIFMAIAVGSNFGCSVVIATLYGAKKFDRLKTAVSTTIIASVVLSFVLTVAGVIFSPLMLNAIQTPENIFEDGCLYLKIYTAGFLFLFLYNIITGIFTSMGDSKTPLWFLIGSSIGNIALDILFAAVFNWGVAGVAWATFIAQGIACILAFFTILKRLKRLKASEKCPLFSWKLLLEIGKFSVPSILQQSFISVGNIFIQSLVNSYGSEVIEGYSAAIKLNTFAVTSLVTIGTAVSNFTGQNLGAEKPERVTKGFRSGMKITAVLSVPFIVAFVFFGNAMITLFKPDIGITGLETGLSFLRIVAPFYFVISAKLVADAVLRGAGAINYFMASTFTDLILRVLLAYVLTPFFGSVGIWLSWPIGWIVSMCLAQYFFFAKKWQKPIH